MMGNRKILVALTFGLVIGGSVLLLKEKPFQAGEPAKEGSGHSSLPVETGEEPEKAGEDPIPDLTPGPEEKKKETPIVVAEKLGWRFERDEAGEVTAITDPAGRKTRLHKEIDAAKKTSRLVRELADGSRIEQEFDGFGRPTLRRDATGVVRYEYDGFGRLHAVRPEKGSAILYEYDVLHRLQSMKVGAGLTLKYAYDILGRLEKIETPAGNIEYSHLTGSGILERKLPGGVRSIWRHGADGRLESITHAGPDDKVMVRLNYTYRPDGLVSQVKQWAVGGGGERTFDFEYDAGRRLTSVQDSRTGTKTVYRYDALGNRLATSDEKAKVESAFDWASRLTKHAGEDCTHDPAFNLTYYPGLKGPTKLTYTVTDQVATIETAAGKVGYRYDGAGRLIERTAAGKTTTFVPDPRGDVWKPLLARDSDGTDTYYLWHEDQPLAVFKGDKADFFLHDHVGTVTHLVDQGGKLAGSAAFCPFGTPTAPVDGTDLKPGFAGLFFDPVAGVYLTQARAYAPDLGRFLQRDPQHRMPFGSSKDLSSYAYCGGDPVNYLDINGAEPFMARPLPRMLPPSAFRPPPEPWTRPYAGPTLLPPPPVLADPRPEGAFRLLEDVLGTKERLDAIRSSGGFLAPPPPPARTGPELRAAPADSWRREIVGGPEPVIEDIDIFTVRRDRYRLRGGGSMIVPTFRGDPRPIEYVPAPGEDRRGSEPSSGVPFGLPGFGAPLPAGAPTRGDLSSYGYDPTAPKGMTGDSFTPRVGMDDGMSKVGGVALKGAGKMLEGIGQLKGIALDAHGRLVLIAQDKGEIELPPLRLDDVVTIFRGVYEHGEAPWVSIDPDEKAPRGPKMNTRLPKSAADTYVGWVLFETDRLMKTYRQGEDNITRKPVRLSIAGYKETMELRFKPGKKGPENGWNRFWITPLTTSRLQAEGGKITLVEVPMQLKNAFELLKDGKLVPSGLPPPHDAEAYCKWFTAHFADLARTVRVRPPAESGLSGEVLVFAELQRMALIAAMAEALRDQGVPMPSWMIDYPVRPCPVPATTPTLTTIVKRTIDKSEWTFRLFGGAVLSPPRDLIKTVKDAPQAKKLLPVVEAAMVGAPLLTPVSFSSDGKAFKAVALPGDETLGFGAVQLAETDLVVPLEGVQALKLTRFFNSFYEPKDVLGTGWTLDLPRLRKQIHTYERTEKASKTRNTYQLTSPLDTYAESFIEERDVPELGGKYLVPRSSRKILALYFRAGKPIIGFRDGSEWLFDDTGRLVEIHAGATRVRYHWSGAGRLEKIEATHGPAKAHIVLDYDAKGRLKAAHGSSKESVHYHYESHYLDRVESGTGPIAYKYAEGRVSDILVKDKLFRRFEYDAAGKLAREKLGEINIHKEVRPGKDGTEVLTFLAGGKDPVEVTKYDALLRPVHKTLEDGTKVTWRYGADGAEDLEAARPDGTGWTLKKDAAGARRLTRRLLEGGIVKLEADAGGRITGIWFGDQPVVQHTYRKDGLLKMVSSGGSELFPYYTKEGILESVFLGGQKKKDGKYGTWAEVKYDATGHPLLVKDQSGLEATLGYDREGRLASWTSKRGTMEIERDDKGRLAKVKTSWGETQINVYDPSTGALVKREWTIDGATSLAEYKDGKLVRLRDFDGTETTFVLGAKGMLQEIRTPAGLTLRYRTEGPDVLVIHCGDIYEVRYRFDGSGQVLSVEETPLP